MPHIHATYAVVRRMYRSCGSDAHVRVSDLQRRDVFRSFHYVRGASTVTSQ